LLGYKEDTHDALQRSEQSRKRLCMRLVRLLGYREDAHDALQRQGWRSQGKSWRGLFRIKKAGAMSRVYKEKRKGQQMCREGLEKAFRVYDGSRGGGRVL